MKTKILNAFLCMLTAVTVVATPASVYAASSELVDSTASSAEDETAGADETQGVKTTYETPETIKTTTYSGNETTTVYATKTSRVVITVPKILVVGEEGDSGIYKGTFNVKVSGDISGSQKVVISPNVKEDFAEINGKDSNTNTEILLDGKKSYTVDANRLLNNAKVVIPGSVVVNGITSGSWKGNISFDINLSSDNNIE